MADAKIILSAEDRASAALKQVRSRVEDLRAAQDKLTTVTGSIGGPLASVAALFTAGGLVGGIKALTTSLDDLDEAAQGIGVSAVALSEFRLAASEAGVDSEKLDKAVTGLANRLVDAGNGGKESAAIFASMGVSVRAANGELKTTEQVLAEVADKFTTYEDGAQKTALASALFGEKLGRILIPFLNQGADGLRKFAGVTEESVRQSALLAKEFDKLAANSEVFKNKVAGGLIPALNQLIAAGNKLPEPGSFWERLRYLASGQAARDFARNLADVREQAALFGNVESSASSTARGKAPVVSTGGKPDREKKEAIDDASRSLAQFIDGLEKERDKLLEISNVEKGLQLLRELGATGQIPQVRQLVLEQAKLADELKNEADMRKVVADAIRDQTQAEKQLRDQILDFAGITDDNRKRSQTEQLDKMIREGILTPEQAERAVKGIAGIRDEMQKTQDVAEEFALVMTSAVSDWLKNPRDSKSFFKALEADIMQLITQLLVLKPLAEAIKGTFSSGDLVGSFGKAFSSAGAGLEGLFGKIGSLFAGGFADGGLIPRGQWGIVGERGPELAFGGASGMTVAPVRAGGSSQVINITVAGNTTRESATQIAAEVSRVLVRANARYN